MIQIIRRVTRVCDNCMGASFGDCETCGKMFETEVVQCHDCKYKAKNVIERKSVLMCTKLHAWVTPTDFCAWGERVEK